MPTLAEWQTTPLGEIAVSDWIDIDQQRVDAFAAATGHTHWLHTDPTRATTDAPYGGTVAHGFLILSLINHAIDLCGLRPDDCRYALNYGVDTVRFLKPMPVGDGFRIRDRITLARVEDRKAGLFMETGHAFEIDGADDGPAVIADYFCLWVPDEA